MPSEKKPRYGMVPDFPGYCGGTDGSVWSCWKRKGLGTGRGSTFVLGTAWSRLKIRSDKDGYLEVRLCRDGKKYLPKVHQLVLLTFRGPCPTGKQARHLDGDNRNNWLSNLRYGTSAENNEDRRRHGTLPKGEQVATSKLTVGDVLQIVRERGPRKGGIVGRRFGVTKECVYAIWKGITWSHVTGIKRT